MQAPEHPRVLAITEELDSKVHMLGVQMTFLKADIEEDVFVKMAPGYDTNAKAGDPLSIKLKNILYDLRQSQKNWFDMMNMELAVIGFRPLKSDPCVYIYEGETGLALLTFYVDDIVFLSASKTLFNKLKKKLMDEFEMFDMGDVSRSFCMNVIHDREKGAIAIS